MNPHNSSESDGFYALVRFRPGAWCLLKTMDYDALCHFPGAAVRWFIASFDLRKVQFFWFLHLFQILKIVCRPQGIFLYVSTNVDALRFPLMYILLE